MGRCPSSNYLIEIKELGSGSHEDDIPLGNDVYIADEKLVDECDDTPDLISYIQIRPASLTAVKATSLACPAMSTPSRDLVSIVVQRPPMDVTPPP